jgi:hypothetical protein
MSISPVYERYPWYIVLAANIQSLAIYATGVFILSKISFLLVWLLIFYILFLEIKLLRGSCTSCYYYGKICAFGRGKLSAWLFRKGDPALFSQKCLTLKDLIPDLLVTLIPVLAGIILLIFRFQWTVLAGVIILIILSTTGNRLIRGSLACRHCVQKTDCPALKLFSAGQDKPN